jgi:hypothetical protein
MKKILVALCSSFVLFSGLASAADFPVTAQYRKALTGPGYVLMVNTTIKEDFPAILTVKNSTIGTERRYEIFLSWRHKNQYGPLEGVTIYGGDEITIGNNNYSEMSFFIPK